MKLKNELQRQRRMSVKVESLLSKWTKLPLERKGTQMGYQRFCIVQGYLFS
jgi:hypothetical protein